MSEFLSQEEVDALIKGLEGGDVPVDEQSNADQPEAVPYDFGNIEFLPRKAPAGLDLMQDRFASLAGRALSSMFAREVDVRVAGSRVTRFDNFLSGIRVPGALFTVFQLPTLGFYGVLSLCCELVFPLIESLLGGKGVARTKLEGRDFSRLESRLIDRMAGLLLREYAEAWRMLQQEDLKVVGSETNPRYLTMFPSSEIIISTSFAVDTQYARGNFLVCLPYLVSDRLRHCGVEQTLGVQQDAGHWLTQGLMTALKDLSVEVKAVLGHSFLRIEDVMRLKEGDLLPLDTEVDGNVLLLVEGREKFAGIVGATGGRNSVKIQSVLAAPEAEE